jgi:hypothetical protein
MASRLEPSARSPAPGGSRRRRKGTAYRIIITPVIAHMSAEPARICPAKAAPHSRERPTPGERSAPSAASSTQGIHAAPAKWCQRLTIESSGPEPIQMEAATKPAARVEPRRRANRNIPIPASSRWPTT